MRGELDGAAIGEAFHDPAQVRPADGVHHHGVERDQVVALPWTCAKSAVAADGSDGSVSAA